MRRILVVSVNWLGDAILITPVFKALKQKFPDSYLGVMAVERIKGIFEGNPYIDEVIIFDERLGHKSLFTKIKFISFLKQKRFDTAFFVQRSFTRIIVCFLAGIKRLIGYKRFKTGFILTDKVKMPSGTLHRQDQYLYLFRNMGIAIKDSLPQIFIPEQIRDDFKENLKTISKKYSYLVGVNPSANWSLKRWPDKYFSRLCDLLIRNLNAGVIFIGSNKDKSVVDKVIKQMKESAYNFCGKTTLPQLGALIQKTNLFLSADSGPAHLSAALGVSTLVLFGPTSEAITSPKGSKVQIIRKNIDCQIPCYKINCKDNICMKDINVEEVFQAANKILTND